MKSIIIHINKNTTDSYATSDSNVNAIDTYPNYQYACIRMTNDRYHEYSGFPFIVYEDGVEADVQE